MSPFYTAQAVAKLLHELGGVFRRRKVLEVITANDSRDWVARRHWVESLRKHFKADVYGCVDAEEAVVCVALIARARC